MTLTTFTAPLVEPLEVDEVKARLRIYHSDEDDDVSAMIAEARAAAEAFTRRRFITQVLDWRRTGLGGVLQVPVAPVQNVVSITYLDTAAEEQVLDASLWRLATHVSPPMIVPAHLATWPSVLVDVDTVRIRVTVGYGVTGAALPPDIRSALMLWIGALWEERHDRPAGDGLTRAQAVLSRHVVWV